MPARHKRAATLAHPKGAVRPGFPDRWCRARGVRHPCVGEYPTLGGLGRVRDDRVDHCGNGGPPMAPWPPRVAPGPSGVVVRARPSWCSIAPSRLGTLERVAADPAFSGNGCRDYRTRLSATRGDGVRCWCDAKQRAARASAVTGKNTSQHTRTWCSTRCSSVHDMYSPKLVRQKCNGGRSRGADRRLQRYLRVTDNREVACGTHGTASSYRSRPV